MLKVLLEKAPTDIEIEIIIATCENQKQKKIQNKQNDIKFKLICDLIKKEFKNLKIKLGLYIYSKILKDHARYIITNYWFIKSGNSFGFFDYKGIREGIVDSIDFKFIFKEENMNVLEDFIDYIKEYVEKTEDDKILIGKEEERLKRIYQNKPFDKQSLRLLRE